MAQWSLKKNSWHEKRYACWEWLIRLGRGLWALIPVLIIFLLGCLALGSCVNGFPPISSTSKIADRVFEGAELSLIYGDSSTVPEVYQFIGALFGVFIFSIGLGFVAEEVSRPARPIRFARYAIINTEKGCLRLRYWIRLPSSSYLANATCNLVIETPVSLLQGGSGKQPAFAITEPNFLNCGDAWFGIRGFRSMDIPLDQKSDKRLKNTLATALYELANNREGFMRIRISGTDPRGNQILEEHIYRHRDVLLGFEMAKYNRSGIRQDYQRWKSKDKNVPEPRKNFHDEARYFPEHLSSVVRIPVTCYSSNVKPYLRMLRSYAGNQPHRLLEIAPGEYAGITYDIRRVALEARERLDNSWLGKALGQTLRSLRKCITDL